MWKARGSGDGLYEAIITEGRVRVCSMYPHELVRLVEEHVATLPKPGDPPKRGPTHAERIAERRRRVQELRADRHSIRAIALELGVSKSLVEKDLTKTSTPKPATVHSLNGRTYTYDTAA